MKEEDDYQDKLRVQLKLKDDIEIGKTPNTIKNSLLSIIYDSL